MFSSDIYKSWQPIQRQKFIQIKRHLGSLADEIFRKKHVLDIGCGNGYLEKEFDAFFIGIDKDLRMLNKPVAIFPLVAGDGNELPFKDNAFDSVVSIDTMHLITKNEFSRVLKPGGFLMLTIFHNKENYHQKREMLLDKLENMDVLKEFDIVDKESEYVVVARKK